MSRDDTTVRARLDAYRALLRHDGPVPALRHLVALLESELGPADGGQGDSEPGSRVAPRRPH